jgi:alpha-beta hydrolase superfamily lysophospholipase
MQSLTTVDGVPLHLRDWAVPDPRGTVLIVHGLGEHIGRYQALAEDLNDSGWTVTGFDLRGHGASAGARGGINAPDSLLADLGLVVDRAYRDRSQPLVLLGHSLGGLIAARFVAESLAPRPAAWSAPVDALVLSSPALDAGLSLPQRLLLAVLGRLTPDLAVANGLDPQAISRDAKVVAAYLADPLVHSRITPRLVRFIVDAGRVVAAAAARWQVPTLLQYAGADRCVAPAGSAAFAAAAPRSTLKAIRYAELAHEIFNEPERAQVIGDLGLWLSRLPASTMFITADSQPEFAHRI